MSDEVIQSLEDAKKAADAEQAAEEAKAKAAEEAEEEFEEEGESTASDEPKNDGAKPEAKTEGETEEWMKGDEDATPPPQFTHGDMKAARLKYKAQISAKDSEIDALRKQVEALEKKPIAAAVSVAVKPEPKREQYKSDVEFLTARQDWALEMRDHEQRSREAAALKQQAQESIQTRISEGVEAHLDRAAATGISPELFTAAETRVRMAVNEIFPGAGDAVTDAMIAAVGEGSEKVFYNLGVNKERLNRLVTLLKNDKTGIQAAAYVGSLKTELRTPAKRESKAPPPMDEIQGDKAQGDNGNRFRKQYQEAMKSGDGQAMFNARRAAKAAGINVKTWK